jgi:putative two-component system response regulator
MSSYRILVVEDDFATGELLHAILEQNDYQVTLRTDGVSALKALDEEPFDLALVDVMLPNLNGFQICERIRDDPRHELMPVIILTVLAESQHRIRALQAGATSFLNKPFDRLELLTQIHSLINLSHKISKRESFDSVIACFTTMLELRNPGILAHGRRVAKLAEQLGYRMGLPLSATGELKAGALLHDIGKLCLPPSEEGGAGAASQPCPDHAGCGDRMFAHFHRPVVRAIIRLHHEDGLAGSALTQVGDGQIRSCVQIVALCNRFDHLLQESARGQEPIQAALAALDGEVRAKGWDREVQAQLAELSRTFGNGLLTVFA